jgi:hypothetical protein
MTYAFPEVVQGQRLRRNVACFEQILPDDLERE